jgi:hypothetical protein
MDPAKRSQVVDEIRERVRQFRSEGAWEECPLQEAPAARPRDAAPRSQGAARRGVDPV